MKSEVKALLPVAEAITKLLHPHAEVVVHDMQQNNIAAIFNAYSKRQVGDDSLLSEQELMATMNDCVGPYPKTNWDGRQLKSVSSVVRDSSGDPVAMLCINLDISQLQLCQQAISQFINLNLMEQPPEPLFVDDWQTRVNEYVHQYLADQQLSLHSITRDDKRKIVHHLNEVGAFSGKNAAQYIAQILGVSRASVYQYLKATQKSGGVK